MLDFYENAVFFVLMPEDNRYNDGFFVKTPVSLEGNARAHFEHIHEVVGHLY